MTLVIQTCIQATANDKIVLLAKSKKSDDTKCQLTQAEGHVM